MEWTKTIEREDIGALIECDHGIPEPYKLSIIDKAGTKMAGYLDCTVEGSRPGWLLLKLRKESPNVVTAEPPIVITIKKIGTDADE